MSELRPLCPAATALAGPPGQGPSIVCGVVERDRQVEDGIGLTAGGTGSARNAPDGVLQTQASGDWRINQRLCCGTGVPVLHADEGPDGTNISPHYTCCPKWQAEKHRIWEDRGELASEDAKPDPFATDAHGNQLDPFSDIEFGGLDPAKALDPVEGYKGLAE